MVDNWLNFVQGGVVGRILDFAAPPRCLLCASIANPEVGLCELCIDMLPRPPQLPTTTHGTSGCALAVAALDYRWPVDELVQELKFAGAWPVARCFGALLARQRRSCDGPLPQVVMAVPLHPRRLAERGFNQAEHIARFAAASLGLPLARHLLQRKRYTAVQSRLNAAARRANLRGAFAVSSGGAARIALAGRRVALVDDVHTTGSTFSAATEALQRAGVSEIEWWSATRAGSHH